MMDLLRPFSELDADSPPARFRDLARRGKPGLWRYAAVVIGGAALAVVGGGVLGVLLALTGRLTPATTEQMTDPGHPIPFYLGIAASFGLLLVGFWACSRWLQGKRFADVVGHWSWRLWARGFCLWAVIVALDGVADYVLRPAGFSSLITADTPRILAVAVPVLALQTFAEEFVFRGVITQGLVRLFRRPAVACVVSGLVFGAVHIPNGAPQAVSATVFGVMLAALAIESGGLALGWGIHLANNLFSAVVLVSTADVFKGGAGLIRQNTPDLMGFDVGFNLVAMLVGAALLLRFSPSRRAATLED